MEIGVKKAAHRYNYGTASAFELNFLENNLNFGRQTKHIVKKMDVQRRKKQTQQNERKEGKKILWKKKEDRHTCPWMFS